MSRLLQELNPQYDMSGHTLEFTPKDYWMFAVNTYKSVLRGTIIGGILGSATGTIVSLVSGNDVGKGALDGLIIGGILGFAIDTGQYIARYMTYRIKHTIVLPVYRMMENPNS